MKEPGFAAPVADLQPEVPDVVGGLTHLIPPHQLSSDGAATDDVLTWDSVKWAPQAPRSSTDTHLPFVYGADYGVAVNNPDNQDAIDDAMAAALALGGGRVLLPSGTLTTTGGHEIPLAVSIEGMGASATTIDHTGDNFCFRYKHPEVFADPAAPMSNGGVYRMTISGNSGTSARAIELSDSWSAFVDDVEVDGYTALTDNVGGCALVLYNDQYWTEGTTVTRFHSNFNGCAIRLLRGASGNTSFGYNKFLDWSANVGEDAIGLDIGGDSTLTCLWYHGQCRANLWLQGDNATGLRLTAYAFLDWINWWLMFENNTGATGVVGVDQAAGVSAWNMSGHVRLDAGGYTNNLPATSTWRFIGEEWTEIRKVADESVTNSTAIQNDDELSFATVSAVGYDVEISLVYSSGAGGGVPDLKIDLGEDATARGTFAGVGMSTADAAQSIVALSDQTSTLTFGTGVPKRVATIRGNHVGNGGTFRVRWAQNTANVNPTWVHYGSFLRYRPLA